MRQERYLCPLLKFLWGSLLLKLKPSACVVTSSQRVVTDGALTSSNRHERCEWRWTCKEKASDPSLKRQKCKNETWTALRTFKESHSHFADFPRVSSRCWAAEPETGGRLKRTHSPLSWVWKEVEKNGGVRKSKSRRGRWT